MRDFEWQQADQFYDDLVGTLGTRPAARPTAPAPAPVYKPPGSSFRAGLSDPARLFDNIVHGGMEAASLLESENAEDEGSEWETVALPGSATPPERVPRHALVVRRALGEGRLACVQTLGRDVELPALYGLDGRIRPDVLIIVQRIQRVQRIERAPVVRRRRAIILERESEDSDLSFLRWSPATRAGRFPPRDKSAIGGRAFMEKIKGEGPPSDWVKRENAIVAELSAGNMPDNLLKWIKIDLTYTGKSGTLTGTVEVLPDYLAIGSNDDYVHVPLDPVSAQLIADRFDATLPTAKICHAIYLQTSKKNRINAIERATTSWPTQIVRSQERTRADVNGRISRAHGGDTGTHEVRGHLARRTGRRPQERRRHLEAAAQRAERVAFHGFYDSAEYPHEPCYENPTRKPQPGCNKEAPTLAHNRRFSDYAQGVRLVHPSMTINGKQKMVADVLADPVESLLLSTEGTIVPARIPRPSKPTRGNPVESDEATEDVENVEDVENLEDIEYVEDLEAEQAPSASSVTIAAASGLGSERTVSATRDGIAAAPDERGTRSRADSLRAGACPGRVDQSQVHGNVRRRAQRRRVDEATRRFEGQGAPRQAASVPAEQGAGQARTAVPRPMRRCRICSAPPRMRRACGRRSTCCTTTASCCCRRRTRSWRRSAAWKRSSNASASTRSRPPSSSAR
jgi:hypothetical protein